MLKYSLLLLVILPLLISVGVLFSQRIPDGLLDGDGALIELSVRAIVQGDYQLIGPYSRFGFRHPGPSYFYLLVPLYWLSKNSALSLYLSVLLCNIASISGILVIIWHATTRWIFLWTALVLSLALAYLQHIVFGIWNPTVPMFPFLLAVVCFAALAIGKIRYLPLAIFLASFVVQTHLGYVPAIAIIAGSAFLLYGFPQIRALCGIHSQNERGFWKMGGISLIVVTVLWMLPLIEQLTESPGNLSRIIAFFTEQSSDRPWRQVYNHACEMFAQFPSFLFAELVPLIPQGRFLQVFTLGQGLLLLCSYWYARRQKNAYFTVLSLFSLLLFVSAFLSIQRIIGPVHTYLIIWMTAFSALNGIVIGGIVLQPIASTLRSSPWMWRRWVLACTVCILCCGMTYRNTTTLYWLTTALVERRYIDTHTRGLDEMVRVSHEFLTVRGVKRCLVKHASPQLWTAVPGIVTQLDKAGIQARVDPGSFQYPKHFRQPAPFDGVLILTEKTEGERLQPSTSFELIEIIHDTALLWQPFEEDPER
jgi:hypothetical protein